MKLHMIGCSHQNVSIDVLEKMAFSPDQRSDSISESCRSSTRR